MYTKNVTVIKFNMIKKVIGFFISYILMVVGFSYFWLYLNLFSFGYSISEYFIYILGRYECYLFIIGLVIFIISLNRKGNKK